MKSDIALIFLNEAVDFKHPSIQPICLPEASFHVLAGQITVATGWGRTSVDGPRATVLQEVSLEVVAQPQCQTAYSGTRHTVDDDMMCAGRGDRQGDTCEGRYYQSAP